MQRVLILCTANSARSQMAEGLLRHDAPGRFEVASAGTQPAEVHPLAIRAMAEIGIDIGAYRSKSIEEFLDQPFDYAITVCDRARESCPVLSGPVQRLHWSIADPAAMDGGEQAKLAAFRAVRDELREKLRGFAASA